MSYRAADNVPAREVEGELVLLDLDEGSFHGARGLGARVWELVTAGHTVDDVVEGVAERYDGDRSSVRFDAEPLLASLTRRVSSLSMAAEPPARVSRSAARLNEVA